MLGIIFAIFDAADKADIILISYDLGSCVLDWLTSFLRNRLLTVSFAGSLSAIYTVLYGVLQGSVLGSLLHVLYTDDVCDVAASYQLHMHCYADNIQLYMHCAVADIGITTRNI